MKQLISFLSIICFFCLFTTEGKTQPITFQKTFGGSGNDYSSSVQQTSDGGYIIAGYTRSIGIFDFDVYLIKTDSNGDTLFTKTFGGSDWDDGRSVQQTTDGGYILAGYTSSLGAGSFDVYLIKTDANGDTLFTKTFGGSGNDHSNSVQQTSDGGYIIAGVTYSFGAGFYDVYLIKTDVNGDTLFTKTYGGGGDDYGSSIQQTSDGGYIIAGGTESFGTGSGDVYLIKTDANGNTLFTKTFGGSDNDYGYSVQQTSDGGYIIAGGTESFGADSGDVYLIKTDANGDMLFTKTFGGSGYDIGNSVHQTSDGGYIIAGQTYSFGAGGDVYLIKTDANGNTLFTKTFGGSGYDRSYSVQQTSDGGYIIAGRTSSFGAGGYDVYLIKTDANGIVPVKENEYTPLHFSLHQNYPNPFNPTTTLSFVISHSSFVTLKVYNVFGQEVATLINNKHLEAGNHSVEFNASNLPSGVYFYRLQAGSYVATKKLLLTK
jgi:hypothetical protein